MTEQYIPSAVDYVMPEEGDVRRQFLLPLLHTRQPRMESSPRDMLESLVQPDAADPDLQFNHPYDELVEIAHDLTPGNAEDLRRVSRYALVWSGMKVDDNMLRWTTLDHGFEPGTRIPRVTLPVHSKRLSIRAVPEAWEGNFDTPFRLQRDKNGVQITAADSDGDRTIIASPTERYVTESVLTVAYSNNRTDGTKNITINPLQRCPQRCEFCCRGYHNMTDKRRQELINLAPDEMARFLQTKYPKQDWRSVSGVTLITGDFRSEKAALDYMDGFVNSMHNETGGEWDPRENEHQDIGLSTHLIQSRDAMERAKSLGMRRFLYTAEMVDDASRHNVMYVSKDAKRNVDKGSVSFSGALAILGTAIEVFGAQDVEPILVVGLDPLDKTKRAMDTLKSMGIQRLSRAVLNVYNMNQLSLPRSGFADTVASMQYARDLFESAYPRIVHGDDPTANAPELYS